MFFIPDDTKEDYERCGVANNPNTPPEALERLANDKFWLVRGKVAINPNTSPETLERLANDDDLVRQCVAENPNTSPETLERLANDENWWVRRSLIRNLNTPQYIKDYLKLKQFLSCL